MYGDLFGEFSDEEDKKCSTPIATQKGRKNIRHIKELEELGLETIAANKNEKERRERIEFKEKKFQEELSEHFENQFVLDYDLDNKVSLVSVHPNLVSKLKSHQKEGVKFMWNACYESIEQIRLSPGSGCILAHCMGLGKTLQVITLVHTLLSHKEIGTQTVLICCPKNTLLNWINEFQKWIPSELGSVKVFNPTRFDNHGGRLTEIKKWQSEGGVCVINYELMRILLENDEKDGKQISPKEKKMFHECLCNPGPDLVICDEGHVLKNEETKLSKIMSQLKTLRRIVLTGTPMQNNLKEYHCMIQFVKPNLLGTRNEFTNMFVNPILNGQYENSLVRDVQLMKQRSHILHKQLQGCVQRFDLSTLKTFLPEKQEYVISIALTSSQIKMYKFYLDEYSSKGDTNWKNENVKLFSDYQSLQRIWTHPYSLKLHRDKFQEEGRKSKKGKTKKRKKKKKLDTYDSDDSSDFSDYNRKYPLSWWLRFISYDDIEDATKSGKLFLLLNIIRKCEENDEKLLVFSGSLYSLKMIEHFLKKINDSEFEDPSLCNLTSSWEEEQDYLVLTGQTSSEDRDKYCKMFNNQHDSRLRLFLISTKAGGMGINLTAANRAILFDVSWNPSHDVQSIFRIYRIGQTKPCYVYRFVASGTMEEKMYERQVAKQSISFRVVDEKQIARHYTERELLELYQFHPDKEYKKETPKDSLLKKILEEVPDYVKGIHEHDSLLEHKEEEELLEFEKKDAWSAYNNKSLAEVDESILVDLTVDSFKEIKEPPKEPVKKVTSNPTKRQSVTSKRVQPNRLDFNTKRTKKEAEIIHINSSDEENITIIETPKTEECSKSRFSDSDDSVFLFEIGKKSMRKRQKRKSLRKPLKSWGTLFGKKFGSPDRD